MSKISENRTMTVNTLKQAVEICVNAKRPVMVWGPPGIGKSDSIAQLCESMGGKLYDVRLSLMEPTDLRGMPFFNKESGKMEWAPPVDLPSAEDAANYPVVFLLFDEINSAAPAVQAACYQLALNRKVGTYSLPDNVVIVAAGNREGDRGVVYRMPSPLANRFVHFELRVDFDSWNEWAANKRVHKDVVGFLNYSKDSLYDFDPKSPSKSFATPRSWDFVSQLLNDDLEDSIMTDIVSGTIGEGLALKFMTHRKHASKLPKPEDVLSGKVSELKSKEISIQYSLSTSCCYELQDMYKKLGKTKDEDKWHEAMDTFIGFIMKNFTTEVVVMAMRMALMTYDLPIDHRKLKNFKEFQDKWGKLIVRSNRTS